MVFFKCKMCGGTLEINNETVATCEYCGTQQTLPKLDDEKRANMYDRANHFRRNNEFDKAMGIYEQILNEDGTDSEAYWSLVLCRYGIEYVEDPSSHKRIPTVNRAQFTSVFDDDNYKSALQYADSYQRAIYEEEAKAINEIQKGILAISQKEEPFDIFICYKETDNSGRRTHDSVLANDLYHQLTQEGFKVFFARITLEDKLGSAYEPYIFAALNSSKVMVVLGTKPEFFNAVWVKNEWSRYLALIKQGQKKMLIPAYKDMDPYDLPEEFSHLQAQDMSKLGFMQDLIRGIKKIVQNEAPKMTVVKETVVSDSNTNVAPLLKRAFIFLEDGDFISANEYCEKVLDIDPENARAYLGKLMCELNIKTEEDIKNAENPFDDKNSYQKAIRFGDEKLRSTLEGYIEYIKIRNENTYRENTYARATELLKDAKTEQSLRDIAEILKPISDYKDSADIIRDCLEKAETIRKDDILAVAKLKMQYNVIANYEMALNLLKKISGWKDADQLANTCTRKIQELKEQSERARLEAERQLKIAKEKEEKKRKGTIRVCIALIIIGLLVLIFAIYMNSSFKKYNDAVSLMEDEKYDEAYSIFKNLDDYKDSKGKARLAKNKKNLSKAKIGDCVNFGAYKQHNTHSADEISWLVLDKKDNKILVISKHAIDCKPYNTSNENVTWENCSLRKWLNNDFINEAFCKDELAMIPTVTVSADTNTHYDTDAGNDTKDKVFLLSIDEVNKYFSTHTKGCNPTSYAKNQGAYYHNSSTKFCFWWLRTPGQYSQLASLIIGGELNDHGYTVVDKGVGIRPAMWIDLS